MGETRVMMTVEVTEGTVTVRDERGGEMARVTVPDDRRYTPLQVAQDLMTNVVDDVRNLQSSIELNIDE